jgi:hypothetical protein
MSEATPGRWEVQPRERDGVCIVAVPHDIPKGGTPTNGMVAVAIRRFGAPLAVSEANAALIVRAVNNHADLVKALQWFLNDVRFQVSVGGNPIVVDRMLREASEILTKACLP